MFKNYLISALRFLKRNKLFAGINILGLSIALAVTFIILLFVINELSYNTSFNNCKQIYRALNYYEDDKLTDDETPYVLAKTFKDEFPQVKYAAPTRNIGSFSIKLKDENIPVQNVVCSDSEIFEIFDIAVDGQQNSILDDKNSIVISRTIARKFFREYNPVEKELVAVVNDKEEMFVVKGVFDDIPVHSTLLADCFISSKWAIEKFNQKFKEQNAETDWKSGYWLNWVLLEKNTNVASLDTQFRAMEKKVFGENDRYKYSLQNLSDVYLGSQEINSRAAKGNLKNIRIFSAIALLIIIVAVFNYVILSIAVSTGRAKEIGIRKTNGASIRSVRKQLLYESVVLTMLVLPVALLLAWTGKPYAEHLFQTKLHIIPSNIVFYATVYVALTLFIGLASGFYTTSYLSRLNVISVLKNQAQTGRGKSRVRFALIVVQLVIFCSFISSTLIIHSQYKYALEKDPGYYNQDILFIDVEKNPQKSAAFINNIKAYPDVISAGGAVDALPYINYMSYNFAHFQDKSKKVKVELFGVDCDFVKAMGIQLLEGRSFSTEFGDGGTENYLLNEAAVKALGITDPVGKPLDVGKIIGVVKDFNLHPIHRNIPPLMLVVSDAFVMQVAIHYKPGTLASLLPLIEAEWKKIAPDQPFNYKTIEEFNKEIYTAEKNLSVIISIFALFSLLIASLGLFGLTLFIAKSRTKEIGVKKVLGSSGSKIIYSFLKENFIPVFVASALSVPVNWYFMNKWLSNFSYKIPISLWFFAVAFLVAIAVVGATVFFHSYKASRVNPVEALRYE
jgi:putative ABC transport system permease protein